MGEVATRGPDAVAEAERRRAKRLRTSRKYLTFVLFAGPGARRSFGFCGSTRGNAAADRWPRIGCSGGRH